MSKISVCMTTYNGERFVQEQIESILVQLSKEDELIISDDSSSDATLTIIKKFQDSRIRLIQPSEKLGIIKNFEHALNVATGDYIFLSDQDDVWLSNKVSRCLAALDRNIMVVSDCMVTDKNLNVINPSFFELRHSKHGFFRNFWKNGYLGCCMAFKRELLQHALPIPNDAPMHDIWLGNIAELVGTVGFLPEKLLLYRRHGDNFSVTATGKNLGWSNIIADRLLLFKGLTTRLPKIFLNKAD